MFIARFTERPYQDPESGYFGNTGRPVQDLALSNGDYNAVLGGELYNRYLDEWVTAEDVGFDGLMLNEHHSTPFCMGGSVNVEASILARITKRAKIVLLGNVLPIWDDPLWLAEQLAMIDMISGGRLVAGWVRGTGRESVAHNVPSPFNWERFQEAHDFIVKAWSTPGPFRWESEHYSYRYVNPWARPIQQPTPPMWVPGVMSRNTVKWAAEHRYPYVMLGGFEQAKPCFEYYREIAEQNEYEYGPQHVGFMFKVHLEDNDELAIETARKYVEGPGNIFLEGSRGVANPAIQNLPGLSDRRNLLPTRQDRFLAASRGRTVEGDGQQPAGPPRPNAQSFEAQIESSAIVAGTPKSVLPKIRRVLEELRPGHVFFWDGDGAMSHEDSMRSLRLWEEVIPAVREIADELDLPGSFEVDPKTNQRLPAPAAAPSR
ncbi:MAG: LLM class flavin-dependent oxidoreductase [Dehalococcoidia bacterium]|nr:LLM class flavin-dependent oxidoreductase [Dehalococcoidia bacterium]